MENAVTFLAEFIRSTENRNMPVTVGFGDSILTIAKEKLTAVRPEFNFSSGEIISTVNELEPYLKFCTVKTVVVGCVAGRNGQTTQIMIDNAVETLNHIRATFPQSRIVIYDLLPTQNLLSIWVIETALTSWVARDTDSVFLPMYKKFGGFFGLFPAIRQTDTGLKISDKGIFEFNDLLERAKRVKKNTVVD